ncbi:Protein S-acyltransferase 10 [Lamellibrachia satsuma]|nr:Protein S-acyltransferase 10 [Lamellibrachia satsuma]
MPCSCTTACIRLFHGVFSFAVLYALIFSKTDLQKALVGRADYHYAGAFIGLFTFSLLMYYVTCFIDPGYVRTSHHRRNEIIYGNEDSADMDNSDLPHTRVHLRFCGFCGLNQPLRARHCEDCGRCIHKFDHHCPWLDTCIGERNHRFFYLFLLSETALTFWTIVIAIKALDPLVYKADPVVWAKLNVVLLSVIGFVACCFAATCTLTIMHTYVMVFNVTTWEFVSRHRITYLKNLPNNLNPFHEGYIFNFLRFFFTGYTYNWEHTYLRNTGRNNYDM